MKAFFDGMEFSTKHQFSTSVLYTIEKNEWTFNFSVASTFMFFKILSMNCFFNVEFWTRTSISDGFTPSDISSRYLSTNTLVRKSTLIKFNNILLMDYFSINTVQTSCKI